MLDARRLEVYSAIFDKYHNKIETELKKEVDTRFDEIVDRKVTHERNKIKGRLNEQTKNILKNKEDKLKKVYNFF